MIPIPAAGTDAGAETGGNGDSAGENEGSAGDGSGTGGSTQDVTVEVEFPVTWTEDGKAVAYVTYEFNDSEILAHCPAETWGSGKHILSLYYPIDNLVPNITNTFNVYLRMENGTGRLGAAGALLPSAGRAWPRRSHGTARLRWRNMSPVLLLAAAWA